MHRRSLLVGLLFAPAIIRTPGLLMPIKAQGFTRAELYETINKMRDLMCGDLQKIWDDAVIYGEGGMMRTSVTEDGYIDVKFIPGSEIYHEFYG